MAEEEKRFPWWLVACAVLLVLIAAGLGFIETVGRQGTLVGRLERIRPGMSKEKCLRFWETTHRKIQIKRPLTTGCG